MRNGDIKEISEEGATDFTVTGLLSAEGSLKRRETRNPLKVMIKTRKHGRTTIGFQVKKMTQLALQSVQNGQDEGGFD